MIVSFAVAVYFAFFGPAGLAAWQKIVLGVGITTVAWVLLLIGGRKADFGLLSRPHAKRGFVAP